MPQESTASNSADSSVVNFDNRQHTPMNDLYNSSFQRYSGNNILNEIRRKKLFNNIF